MQFHATLFGVQKMNIDLLHEQNRHTEERWVIPSPPSPLDADHAHAFLQEIERGMRHAFENHRKLKMLRIDLASDLRGGYFANASTAMTALLWDVIDVSRRSAGVWKPAV